VRCASSKLPVSAGGTGILRVHVRPEAESSGREEPAVTAEPSLSPIVVPYLYVHQIGEAFEYPSSRDRSGSPTRLAVRYLECVLVQAASLALRGVDCELVLVTNLADRSSLGKTGSQLLDEIEAIGVEVVLAEYAHRPPSETAHFAASRYVFDAILAVAGGVAPDRPLWFVDVDCVWVDPAKAFAAMPASPAIGCVEIPYPPDWGSGHDRRSIGEISVRMGAPEGPPPSWIGGEVLAGRAGDLRDLVSACEKLEAQATELGVELDTEEQLLTLAAALGRIRLENSTHVAERVWTGPRHGAPPRVDPGSLGLWHLPSEKGLGFRRAAKELRRGRGKRLVRDLESPERAMRRFNVQGAGPVRRLRDDLWLLRQRLLDAARSRGR
jgi:hypothetical protein